MQIKNAEDLFRFYDFESEAKLEIKQYLNANPALLPRINALCFKAKINAFEGEKTTY